MPIQCAGCGETSTKTEVPGLVACRNCVHFQFVDFIGVKKYDREYYEKYNRYEKTDLGKKINKIRWSLVERYLTGNVRVLDWGAGNGSFVRSSPNGFHLGAFDINPFSPYKDWSTVNKEWDAVTMWDVLEHLEHPAEFIGSLKTRYIFLVTPDVTCAKDDLAKWKHFRPDEHQHYFSDTSLYTMLERKGFSVLEVNREEGEARDPENPNALITVVAKKND